LCGLVSGIEPTYCLVAVVHAIRDVLISYSSKDGVVVQVLGERLKRARQLVSR
jgi:hypothetical protein